MKTSVPNTNTFFTHKTIFRIFFSSCLLPLLFNHQQQANAQPQPFSPSLPIKHHGPQQPVNPYERVSVNSQPIQKSHYANVLPKQNPTSAQQQHSSHSHSNHQSHQQQQLSSQQQQQQQQPPQQQPSASSILQQQQQPQGSQSQSRPIQNGPPHGGPRVGGGGGFIGGGQENYIPGNNGYNKINVKSGGHLANKPHRQQQQQQQQQPGGLRNKPLTSSEELELEYEEEQEPDRLTVLLQTSKFQCGGKKDGYYADDTLNCEVFHYCQDGGKHSWLCPNQFAFHQVHLICVPPSSDNICKQSSQFHFVNEYLYRPINEKEAAATNGTLIYADRYYPDGYSVGVDMMPYDSIDDNNSNQSQRPQQPPVNPHAPQRKHGQAHQQPIPHGGHHTKGGSKNVFFSPESINIPLSERRAVVNSPRPNPKYDYDEY